MSVEYFLDTNVLVYAAAGGGPEDTKRKRALELIEDAEWGLSAQVLQEFYVTVTRKIAVQLSAEKAVEWLEQFDAFPCLAIDASVVKIAAETAERYQISYWDGAIVAAADIMGARTLYSEDLNHGQRYGAVRVLNPFRDE